MDKAKEQRKKRLSKLLLEFWPEIFDIIASHVCSGNINSDIERRVLLESLQDKLKKEGIISQKAECGIRHPLDPPF